MVKALNQMTFFGWKVRVNVARFVKVTKKGQNQNKTWAEKRRNPVHVGYNQPESSRQGNLRQGVSWADVAAGKTRKEETENCLSFANESIPFKKWNGRSIIGDLKSIEALRGVSRMKMMLGLKNSQVRYIGGLKLIIIFDSTTEMERILLEHEKTWAEWFNNISKWHGEDIPFERIAWLRIRGVPLQLWIDAVFECIGEKYGKVIRRSDADEDDACFNEEMVGVLVKNGSTIEEKIKINWKNKLLFDVWVSEFNQHWVPEFVNEGAPMDTQTPTQEANDEHETKEDKKQLDSMETEFVDDSIPVPENSPEIRQVVDEQAETEKVAGVGQGENEQVETDRSVGDLEHYGGPQYEEDQVNGDENAAPINATDPSPECGPLNTENNCHDDFVNTPLTCGPEGAAHKKRKRITLAEARSNSLKPQSVVGKIKIPDLNVDISDDSRSRPRKKFLFKKKKTNKRKSKRKIRITEEDLNGHEFNGDSLDDVVDSEWEEEEATDQQQSSSRNSPGVGDATPSMPNDKLQDEEVEATIKVGLQIGVDLQKFESMVRSSVVADQVDVIQQ
ncbi:hypothetical protein HanIR_Chr06g0287411 [Helianthus annuus]|nr:hypothetical protein HanIR_Chr06g0287411 [Helianthus annuus]